MNLIILDYKKTVYPKYVRSLITMTSDVQIKQIYVGLDPGNLHMGITVYIDNILYVSQIDFKPEKDPIQKMLNVAMVVTSCVPLITPLQQGIAVTEGASYGSPFGQVDLAEARASAILTLCQLGFTVKKIPPKQIRKLALGDGNNKGECFDMPMDAASSLLCCLVALSI